MVVGAVVVVAVGREVALGRVVDDEAASRRGPAFTRAYLIAERQSAATDRPAMPQAMVRCTWLVVQRHLEALVGVLVVHVVDDVERVDVGPGEPVHHRGRGGHAPRRSPAYSPVSGGQRRRDLLAGDLVAAAVDRVEQRLGEVDPGAEELHRPCRRAIGETQQAIAVSSPYSGRISSSDSYWIALVSIETWAQNALEALGEPGRPQHRQVRLRGRRRGCRGSAGSGTTCG